MVGIIRILVSHYLVRKKEIESDLRKQKLEYYKNFIRSLNGLLTEDDKAAQRNYAVAFNDLLLVSDPLVLKELKTYQERTTPEANIDAKEYERLLSALMYEMRRNLGINDDDDKQEFRVGLQGVPNNFLKRDSN